MVKEISNIVDSFLPMISIACAIAGAFMGRKFGLAAGYGISSKIADFISKKNIAKEWNKTSSEYWTLAKKDAFRDLTATAGFITLGLASQAGKALLTKEEPREESGWIGNDSTLSKILAAIIMTGAAGGTGLGTWYILNKLIPNQGISKLALEKGVFTQQQKIDMFIYGLNNY